MLFGQWHRSDPFQNAAGRSGVTLLMELPRARRLFSWFTREKKLEQTLSLDHVCLLRSVARQASHMVFLCVPSKPLWEVIRM